MYSHAGLIYCCMYNAVHFWVIGHERCRTKMHCSGVKGTWPITMLTFVPVKALSICIYHINALSLQDSFDKCYIIITECICL